MSDLTRDAIAADPVRAMTGDEIRALIEENERLKAEREEKSQTEGYFDLIRRGVER